MPHSRSRIQLLMFVDFHRELHGTDVSHRSGISTPTKHDLLAVDKRCPCGGEQRPADFRYLDVASIVTWQVICLPWQRWANSICINTSLSSVMNNIL